MQLSGLRTGFLPMQSTVLIFPGQGSQLVGMGQTLHEAEPVARDILTQADEILGFSLSSLCFEGPAETLTDTINAQPAILATSYAILQVLRQKSDAGPAFVAGHSLGEFTALVCAGALSFPDGLRLVRERGRLMKAAGEAQPGSMAAILGMEREVISEICATAQAETGGVVQIANDNCPGQIVISGTLAALDHAMAMAKEKRAKRVILLPVSIASHSPLMGPAAAAFEPVVAEVAMSQPDVPLIGNTSARPLSDIPSIRAELVAQLTHCVRWTESIRYLLAQGIDTFIEIGPNDILTGLMRRIDRKARRFTVQDQEGMGIGGQR